MPHGSPLRHSPVPCHQRERPWLLISFGVIGVLGCAALIVGTAVAAAVVPGHDWIADTISDLAAGRYEIIMDVALYGFAAGLMTTALAASHAHMGAAGWSVGIVSLAILAVLVTVIAARNEYGDKDNEGVVIHMYLVYALGALFLLTCAVMQAGLRASGHNIAAAALIGLGATWAIISAIFLMSATSVDGLIERILGLVACAILMVFCTVFLGRGYALTEGR
ncbi:MAG TPA: DUF998 domain-containing protein [Roseovarius sp.]